MMYFATIAISLTLFSSHAYAESKVINSNHIKPIEMSFKDLIKSHKDFPKSFATEKDKISRVLKYNFDFNGDARQDTLVVLEGEDFCNQSGCLTYAFFNEGTTGFWAKAGETRLEDSIVVKPNINKSFTSFSQLSTPEGDVIETDVTYVNFRSIGNDDTTILQGA